MWSKSTYITTRKNQNILRNSSTYQYNNKNCIIECNNNINTSYSIRKKSLLATHWLDGKYEDKK